MIIDRGPQPPFFSYGVVNLAIEMMEKFYASPHRTQKRYDFPFNKDIDEQLKPLLHERFWGKCGYCEVKIINPLDGVVDRFRPYSGIRDRNEYFEDLYWWLTFKWDNLVYACKECQQFKANYFPIKGKRAMSRTDNLEQEQCLLIDPCKDDRLLHYTYNDQGKVIGTSEMGIQTVNLLRLNRHSHKKTRLEAAFQLTNILGALSKNSINEELHTGFTKYIESIYNGDQTIEFWSHKYWFITSAREEGINIPEAIHKNQLRTPALEKKGATLLFPAKTLLSMTISP